MPRGNGTGPGGWGPMSGRAAGYCAGYDRPGFANPVGGRGRGAGFGFGGRGRGRGYGFFAAPRRGWGWMQSGGTPFADAFPASDPEQEKQVLSNQVRFLQNELESIEKRISEIDSEQPKK